MKTREQESTEYGGVSAAKIPRSQNNNPLKPKTQPPACSGQSANVSAKAGPGVSVRLETVSIDGRTSDREPE